MAKKKPARVTKSQAIRDLLEVSPDISAKDAVAQLKKQGLTVTESLVYNIRSKLTAGATKKATKRKVATKKAVKKKRTKAAKTAAPATDFDFSDLKGAKSLADKLGGIEAAKRALEALAELQQ